MSDFDTIKGMNLPLYNYQGPPAPGVFDLGLQPQDVGGFVTGPDFSGFNNIQQGKVDEQVQPAQISSRIDPVTGQPLVSVKDMPAKDVNEIQQALQFYKQSLASFDNRIGELQQRENQVKGNPIMSVLTQLAGQMAQAKDMPGWVQGAGRANLALNPTADALAHERLGLQKEQAGIASMLAAEADKQRQFQLQEKQIGVQEKRFQSEVEKDIRKDQEGFVKQYEDYAVNKRTVPTPEDFAKEAVARKMTPPEIHAAYKRISDLAMKSTAEELEKDKRSEEKAVAIAKATLPTKIQLFQGQTDIRTEAAKELIGAREEASKRLIGFRYDEMTKARLDTALNRMDIAHLKGLGELGATDFKDIENVMSMRQFVDHMTYMFGPGGKLSGYVGPWEGLLTSKLYTSLSDSDRQIAQHMFMVERKRLIDWGKAGVMGWRPSEDSIKKLGMIETLTPEAMAGIAKEVHNQLDLQLRSKVRAKPLAPWDQMHEVFGGIDSPLYKEAASRSGEFYNNVNAIRDRGMGRAGTPVGQPTGGGMAAPTAAAVVPDFIEDPKNPGKFIRNPNKGK